MKFFFSVLILFTVTACGFTPMYGSGGDNKKALSQVELGLIPDESGVYLRNSLIDRFYEDGYPSSPTYKLSIEKIFERERDLDITIESEATRKQILLRTVINMTDNQTGATVLNRTLSATTSYNVLGSQFTTRISEKDAREAALDDLARQIESQVVLYFKR